MPKLMQLVLCSYSFMTVVTSEATSPYKTRAPLLNTCKQQGSKRGPTHTLILGVLVTLFSRPRESKERMWALAVVAGASGGHGKAYSLIGGGNGVTRSRIPQH